MFDTRHHFVILILKSLRAQREGPKYRPQVISISVSLSLLFFGLGSRYLNMCEGRKDFLVFSYQLNVFFLFVSPFFLFLFYFVLHFLSILDGLVSLLNLSLIFLFISFSSSFESCHFFISLFYSVRLSFLFLLFSFSLSKRNLCINLYYL